MCIICVKKSGVCVPSWDAIDAMVWYNQDGNGYAYLSDGQVHIRKGLMSLQAYKNSLQHTYKMLGDKLTDTPFLYHSRITTHGGTSKGLTHPFMLSDNHKKLKAVKSVCTAAIVHNGILDIDCDNGLSDTASFVKNELYPLVRLYGHGIYHQHSMQEILAYRIFDSKLAIIDGQGIVTIGQFLTDKKTGLLYSNSSYQLSDIDRWFYSLSDYDDDMFRG